MHRFMKCFCMLLVALLMGPVVALGHGGGEVTISYDAVRDYDENVVQANAVDVPSVAGGLDVAAFTTDVAAAWDADMGGVINFEANAALTYDIADRTRHITEIVATYGISGGKTITLLNGDETAWDNIGNGNDRGSFVISGVRRLRKSDRGDNPIIVDTNDYVFDIGTISDGSKVTSMGVTALGRDGADLRYSIITTFNDGSTSSFPDTAPFVAQVKEDPGVTGTADTFFGVTAPSGLWITQFALANLELGESGGGFGHIDDLGFITSPIPEPSSLVLLLGSLVAVSMRTRRVR